ncbi:MAG: hypothetical protein ACK481_11465, partial [Candidatus Melainabacteria bacterium]
MFDENGFTNAMKGLIGWFRGHIDVGQSLRDIQEASSKKLAKLEQAMQSHESKFLHSYNGLNESIKDFKNLTSSALDIALGNIDNLLTSLPPIEDLPENHVFRSIKKDLIAQKAKIEDQLGLHNRSTETLSSIQGWKSQIENIDTSNPIQGWVNSNTLGLKNLSLLQGKIELELAGLQRDGAVLRTTQEQIQQIRIHLESLTEFIESEKQIKEEIQSVSVQLAALNSRGLGEIQ